MTLDSHIVVFMGAGYRCTRCNIAWDIDDEVSTACVAAPVTPGAGDEYRFDASTYSETSAPFKPALCMWADDLPSDFPKSDTMAVQVGGAHYKSLAIQPTEFCQRNGLDFCIGSILKYLTRHRVKNGIEDLRKARHFVEIRESFPLDIRAADRIKITMLEYVSRNGVRFDDAEALYRLETYYNEHFRTMRSERQSSAARRLIEAIDSLVDAAVDAAP